MAHACISALRRQEELHKFKATLVFGASSGQPRSYSKILPEKQTKKEQEQ